jgi:hypothetical protein
VIIKKLPSGKKTLDGNSIFQHIVMNNSFGEVEEFDSLEEAERLSTLMNANTDSGCFYYVRKIGDKQI